MKSRSKSAPTAWERFGAPATPTSVAKSRSRFLPGTFAHHRLARFEREAKTLVSLKRRNTAGIYDGIRALVTERVEGARWRIEFAGFEGLSELLLIDWNRFLL